MKKLLLAFILYQSSFLFCVAQEPNLDSLLVIWDQKKQPDSNRVKAYVDYIWDGFIDHYPDSAEIMAQNLLSFSKEKNYSPAAAKSFYILGYINQHRSNFPLALKYYKRTLKIYEALGDKNRVSNTLLEIGEIYRIQGGYSHALEYYQQSLKLQEEIGSKNGMSDCLTSIGNIYNAVGNYSRGLEYHQKALKISEELGSKRGIGISLMNSGITYSNQGNYALALEYFERSIEIAEEMGVQFGIAVGLTNIGGVYEEQGDYTGALKNYEESLKICEEIGDKPRIALSLNNIGNIYNIQGKNLLAIDFCKKSLRIAEEINLLERQKYACECLYGANKAMGNGNEALLLLEKYHAIDDSLNVDETTKKLQQMEFAKQVFADSLATVEKERLMEEAHLEEVRQKNRTRNVLLGTGFLILILAGTIYSRLIYTRKAKALIEIERARSDNLLLNILPEEIAQELKIYGKAEARDFDLVSILFTDFKGFTEASAKMSAGDLVSEINFCFEAFDGIMEKYGIEKIKTIGDAYMAAGGLPIPTDDSVKNTVLAALEMQRFIEERKKTNDSEGKPAFEMRVGIHTGPVVAGIVGVKKFQYDIWGDTVNTASRMESSGEVGKVNISQATYELLKSDPQFVFESRGKIEAKGKGEMEMWFVRLKKK